MERTALQRNEALADQLGATIDEARALGAVLQGTARDVVEVGLVEVGLPAGSFTSMV